MNRLVAFLALAIVGWSPRLVAAQAPLTGFTAAGAARQSEFERTLEAAGDTARLRRHLEFLATRVRVAGTPAQIETADYVLRELASYGLDTVRTAYRVYLPYPDSLDVYRMRPRFVSNLPLRLLLNEIPVKGDSVPERQVWRAMAAYSGGGDRSGPLVFAHLGRAEDYRALDSLGIDVRGKVVLVRLGAGTGRTKVRVAEARGVAAVVLYSDPSDDGYVQGDPFPVGPMRPPDGVDRFSLQFGAGDPSTPGWAATPSARRLPPDSMAVPRIPVIPISYRNAMHLLPVLGGPSVPQAWQGGLPVRYHVGGDTNAVVRVAVWPETGDRAYKTIVNTVATLRGSELPDEIVLVGARRDAWGRGAADNASGVASLLEVARVLGEAARTGHRPRRTVVLTTWDAGEWGQIGATEYAEQFGEQLRGKVVAYVNYEVAVAGHAFSAAADPVLTRLLQDAAGAVPAPHGHGSVLEAWRAVDTSAVSSANTGPVPMAVRTSDYCNDCEPIRRHFGAPALEFGFREPNGLINSAYDGLPFLLRADAGLSAHVATAQLGTAVVSRLADGTFAADDYDALARSWAATVRIAGPVDGGKTGSVTPLAEAVGAFAREAQRWNEVRDAALTRSRPAPDGGRLRLTIAEAQQAIDELSRRDASPTVADVIQRVKAATAELARTSEQLR